MTEAELLEWVLQLDEVGIREQLEHLIAVESAARHLIEVWSRIMPTGDGALQRASESLVAALDLCINGRPGDDPRPHPGAGY
jgi:hypothetical protein